MSLESILVKYFYIWKLWDIKEGLKDVDATILAFLLLRLLGYEVSAEDILKILKRIDEFPQNII